MVAQVIQTDYDCLEAIAAEFTRHADCTVVLTFQAEQLCDRLANGGWCGLGAQAFFAEMRELVFPAMRRLQDGLQFAGDMTRRICDVMRTHEEEAARLFSGEAIASTSPPQQDQGTDSQQKWWQNAPQVSYVLRPGESLQDLARRLGIDLGALLDLNGGVAAFWMLTAGSRINLPVPGLIPDHPIGDDVSPQFFSEHGRSFLPYPLSLGALAALWQLLTPLQQEIEFALAFTSNYNAPFTPALNYKFTMEWIAKNLSNISDISARFDIDPALVAGILSSEMLFDYDWKDALSDKLGVGEGSGFASTHDATLIAAYNHMKNTTSIHPWDTDSSAPTLGRDDPTGYTLTDKGTIAAAALVARYYTDYYIDHASLSPAEASRLRNNLSPNDMAAIFGAYRQGCEEIPPYARGGGYDTLTAFRNAANNLGDNGKLALPLMRYFTGVSR